MRTDTTLIHLLVRGLDKHGKVKAGSGRIHLSSLVGTVVFSFGALWQRGWLEIPNENEGFSGKIIQKWRNFQQTMLVFQTWQWPIKRWKWRFHGKNQLYINGEMSIAMFNYRRPEGTTIFRNTQSIQMHPAF